ncbi:(Fe-S)-binding protein [Aestuariispira insulae]|uniref:L-lactate dehydrogenase complex protein LldE n=1 Tax=Aestuariispira insulae TaxID=1461337 RepID=A0A3D9HPP6_9PROT|nr:(Fe-S)-binding protein [Aestuariispira insulae]RED51375.1 L-lactate dehydrogenase complex protein LldE [Aestuariispira insulae]
MTIDQGGVPSVGLFVTCLADLFRPQVAFAAVRLLEQAGCEVSVPEAQTCCGQPAFNSGDNADSRAIARQTIEAFEAFDYVVAPSGSCAAMIKQHYPELFETDPEWFQRAQDLSRRTFELVSFLIDILKYENISARYDGKITYHDSCSGLRELSVKQQPRALLSKVEGLELKELPGSETCCGFGGTFCVKYPEISNKMVEEKTADIVATGADTLVAGDLGCLMNMAGKLKRQGHDIKARHVAEILAGMGEQPAIGEPEGR